MKLITAIAALALVAGSVSLVQPALAKFQNSDELYCVQAGFQMDGYRMKDNIGASDCDNDNAINPEQDDYPPFEWVYDPETKYIRSLTKPYLCQNREENSGLGPDGNGPLSQAHWHRYFSSTLDHPADYHGGPTSRSKFVSTFCTENRAHTEWRYDSDTKLLSLDAFPAWCLTISPPAPYPKQTNRFLFIAPCGDPSEYWAQLGSTYGPFPEAYSQRWEIPLADNSMAPPEDEEEELVEEEEESGEEPRRSPVTFPPGEEEASEDDGPILNKDETLGSKKRGKNLSKPVTSNDEALG